MKKLNTLKGHLKNLDYYIFIPYIILSLIGIIMVYSASYSTVKSSDPSGIMLKQGLYFVAGLVIIITLMSGNNKIVKSKGFVSSLGFLLTVALAYLWFFGTKVNGAAGWINLGPINIQPAEIAKVYFIIRFARVIKLEDYKIRDDNWIDVFKGRITLSFVILFLIFKQPDLGGALINFLIIAIMILASGIYWKKALKLFFVGVLFFIAIFGIAVGFIKLGMWHSYQANRIISFINPFKDHDAGYQVINSYYALSNGGIFGRGLGNSVQKNGYLPEPNTDFIMAVISEELGLIMVILILALLMFMVCRVIVIGVRSSFVYDKLVCYGVAFYMTVQSLINTGAVTGMMPITGVTFPFISYGGSSMLTLSFCIGLTLVISANQGKRS
ncbi:FtsW/RodA/SpoVE family cell cycle protein [Apilactobacillus xinyiensis]|uniref:Probable peptidoglycan glycosyltransferase FtsW n=1 Tax=Apilactobacillus xinyiensis TaxID=2841032 RepID=A0ABT0I1X4_9LACO|nr:FtsW/RodA/SpoVE family cell cycle protein [Apilactobacillus xinyiensis]MCK8624723.1 FtsW/RodA/SpoVE family cell cycle protein [Apilactobacillus xinyiensis]MCL0318838.1 FtsW/RodA/SpoVE family cell cycle protein [Apilactobacillus xinyiensis]MCL0329920.1 FtsW/RodA/SpoVE family cell cycle protein [Apilactobacillus xinyiensis]